MQLDRCQASRDGTTRLVYPGPALINSAHVERALSPPPQIPCLARSTDLTHYYLQETPDPPTRVRWRVPDWSGTEVLNWGPDVNGSGGVMALVRYRPANRAWTRGSTLGQPNYRVGYSGTWIGSQYLVWGGEDATGLLQSGFAYSPTSDSWTRISNIGAPSARTNHAAVWTGQSFIVFGGEPLGGDLGGRYDPFSDTWSPLSSVGAPAPLASLANGGSQLVWTGSELLVWTGQEIGRYDPLANAWLAVTPSSPVVPIYPAYSFAGWAHSRLWIVSADGGFQTYDPATQQLNWSPPGAYFRLGTAFGLGFSTGSEVVVSGAPSVAFPASQPVLWESDGGKSLWTGSELLMETGTWAAPP